MKFSRPDILRSSFPGSRRCIAVFLIAAMVALGAPEAFAQKQAPKTLQMVPISITSVQLINGQLVANGLIGSHPIQLPLTLTALPSGGTCPILHLQVGEIHLTLLGLNVDTSEICLDITAQQLRADVSAAGCILWRIDEHPEPSLRADHLV